MLKSDSRIPSPESQVPHALHIDQMQRILQHRHHPESEQIDFDESHVGAVVLVPLDDDTVGHAGVLEGDDVVEAAVAHHHPAGVLAEMPRQILDQT